MISEGSSDTKDWSNDTENSALLHHKNKWHCKTWEIIKYFSFTVFFLQNDAVLVSLKYIFYKYLKILPTPNIWMAVYI